MPRRHWSAPSPAERIAPMAAHVDEGRRRAYPEEGLKVLGEQRGSWASTIPDGLRRKRTWVTLRVSASPSKRSPGAWRHPPRSSISFSTWGARPIVLAGHRGAEAGRLFLPAPSVRRRSTAAFFRLSEARGPAPTQASISTAGPFAKGRSLRPERHRSSGCRTAARRRSNHAFFRGRFDRGLGKGPA